MSKDYFEDRTSFEDRFCNKCTSIQTHMVLSRWGVTPKKGRKEKTNKSGLEYESETIAHCVICFPFVLSKK